MPTATTYSWVIYQQKITLTEFYLTLSHNEIIHFTKIGWEMNTKNIESGIRYCIQTDETERKMSDQGDNTYIKH